MRLLTWLYTTVICNGFVSDVLPVWYQLKAKGHLWFLFLTEFHLKIGNFRKNLPLKRKIMIAIRDNKFIRNTTLIILICISINCLRVNNLKFELF